MASYKNGSITLENVYGKKTYETTIVECGSSTELQELIITENGTYEAPEGTGYSPVKVNIPQTVESGTLKALFDATKSTSYLFNEYNGTNIDGLISYSDTANVTNMSYMFYKCRKLTSIPELDTSNVTNMTNFALLCYNLPSIPRLFVPNCSDFSHAFDSCINLTSIGIYGFRFSINISETALEHDALVAFLNQAGTAYDSYQKIVMGAAKLALLSDEEKAIATNKGWTLA